jgi:hypothetical protein
VSKQSDEYTRLRQKFDALLAASIDAEDALNWLYTHYADTTNEEIERVLAALRAAIAKAQGGAS